jgi:thioredoxin-dependent peroxiredoxin
MRPRAGNSVGALFAHGLDLKVRFEDRPQARFLVVHVRNAAFVAVARHKRAFLYPLAAAVARVSRRGEGRDEETAAGDPLGERVDSLGDALRGAVQECVRRDSSRETLLDGAQRRGSRGIGVGEREDVEPGKAERLRVAAAPGAEIEDARTAREALRELCGQWVGRHRGDTSAKGTSMLTEGDKLPAISLEDDAGKRVKTTDLLDGSLLLYFYPKDDTPGCTNEASQFRDLLPRFKRKKVRVVGVSRDSVASHQKFKKKYSLTFPLLADVDSKLCDAFGVIVDKQNYGKTYKGIQRSTFLINEKGKIVKVWPKVTADGHADEVLEYLSAER